MGRQDKRKIKELEKELQRKDRALAETTALLVLKKKADLIWGNGENAVSVEDRRQLHGVGQGGQGPVAQRGRLVARCSR